MCGRAACLLTASPKCRLAMPPCAMLAQVPEASAISAQLLELLQANSALNSKAFLVDKERDGKDGKDPKGADATKGGGGAVVEFVGNRTECALLMLLRKLGADYSQIRKARAHDIVKVCACASRELQRQRQQQQHAAGLVGHPHACFLHAWRTHAPPAWSRGACTCGVGAGGWALEGGSLHASMIILRCNGNDLSRTSLGLSLRLTHPTRSESWLMSCAVGSPSLSATNCCCCNPPLHHSCTASHQLARWQAYCCEAPPTPPHCATTIKAQLSGCCEGKLGRQAAARSTWPTCHLCARTKTHTHNA
jgi:hypothetical protein